MKLNPGFMIEWFSKIFNPDTDQELIWDEYYIDGVHIAEASTDAIINELVSIMKKFGNDKNLYEEDIYFKMCDEELKVRNMLNE